MPLAEALAEVSRLERRCAVLRSEKEEAEDALAETAARLATCKAAAADCEARFAAAEDELVRELAAARRDVASAEADLDEARHQAAPAATAPATPQLLQLGGGDDAGLYDVRALLAALVRAPPLPPPWPPLCCALGQASARSLRWALPGRRCSCGLRPLFPPRLLRKRGCADAWGRRPTAPTQPCHAPGAERRGWSTTMRCSSARR